MMEHPPSPPTALPPVPVSLTGPDGILNHSLPQSLRYPYPSERCLTNTSTANLVPRVFGLFGQRDNAAQKARIRPEDDPKTLLGQKQILWIRDTRLRAVRNDIHPDGPGFPLSVIFWEKIMLELNP